MLCTVLRGKAMHETKFPPDPATYARAGVKATIVLFECVFVCEDVCVL